MLLNNMMAGNPIGLFIDKRNHGLRIIIFTIFLVIVIIIVFFKF